MKGVCEGLIVEDVRTEYRIDGIGDASSPGTADGELGCTIACDDGGYHVVKWAFVGTRSIWVAGPWIEAGHTVTESKSEAWDRDT
ncbi:MAG: hypothetical protein RLZZ458_604 [Planctomycetota bacterium]